MDKLSAAILSLALIGAVIYAEEITHLVKAMLL